MNSGVQERLGLVGLGNIGENICRCFLNEGYDVIVYDTSEEAVARLGDTSARVAASLKELTSEAEIILLSLPNSDIVEKVIRGPDGLMDGLSAGDVVIDTSSSRPPSTRELARELGENGVGMLDAPVSGGVLKAKEGKLSVMVGGDEGVFERCRGVLGAFGERVTHVGGSGAGHLIKSLNNMLSATTLVSAAEAMLLAEKEGIPPETFLEVINAGNGRSYSTEVKFPRFILDGSFEDGFSLDLMTKDLKVALQSAAEAGHPMLSGSVVSQIWQAAANHGYGSKGHTSIYDFIERFYTGEES